MRLCTQDGAALGTATFNPHTLIAGRLLSRTATEVIDAGWIVARLRAALAWRERLFTVPCYRLIHAEADGLPALVIDRFADTVVVQPNSAGMERLLPEVLTALERVLAPHTVVVRRDSAARTLEGLETAGAELVRGALDAPVRLEENGATFFADLAGGQKTGWFYDQRDNRAFAARLSAGARVADFYCYTGGFAVTCALAGAASVLAVDRSAPALELVARAAAANGVESRCQTRRAEVFEALDSLAAAGERFDLVIADPPAFVKSRKDLPAGSRAYRKLARLAATLVAPGGFLLMASCSHNMEVPLFAEQVARGLADAGREGRILRQSGAGADHPVHPFLPESAYLKALTLQLT